MAGLTAAARVGAGISEARTPVSAILLPTALYSAHSAVLQNDIGAEASRTVYLFLTLSHRELEATFKKLCVIK